MPRGMQFPQLWDEDWLRRRYEQDGAVLSEIAAEVGTSDATVLNALRRAGISTRSSAEQRMRRGTGSHLEFAELGDREWLAYQYSELGRSFESIGKGLGCTGAAVRRACARLGIPARSEINRVFRGKVVAKLSDAAWLRHQRQALGKSREEIADELGCSPDAVQKAFWRHGVRIREFLPSADVARSMPPITRDKDGYILQYDPEHPAAIRGFVGQHRLVAERELGRLLTRSEVVHHLNINPSDNRPDNLIVFPNNGVHMSFHANPPAWVPRCKCCGKPNPEVLSGRPPGVPMLYQP